MTIRSFFEKWGKSQLARNTLWMLLGQGARIPIQALYFVLIARALGVNGYGAYVGVTALVAVLAPFGSLGCGNILVKNVARDRSCFRLYWGKALLVTAVTGAMLLLVVALASMVLLPAAIPFMLVFSIALADLVFARALEVSAQAFQAFQRLARTSQLSVLPSFARLACLLALLAITGTPSATLWGYFYLLGNFISAVLAIALVCRELGAPVVSKGMIFKELKEGFYFAVSLSSQNIYNDIDKTMLARLSSLESAGIYGAAYRIVDVSFAPVFSLLHASYARFFKSGLHGIKGTLAFSAKLLPYAAGYGLGVSLLLFVAAPLLPIILGKEYEDTVLALRWLSFLPFFRSIHYFAANSLTGAGFQGVRSSCQLLTVMINVVLIFWLIPAYSWKGAAWASLATDFILAVMLWLMALWIRRRQNASDVAHLHLPR